MADRSMVIRIAADVSELKRNLAEGKSHIEALEGSVRKIGTGLQGDRLIQNANNIVAAVDRIGGAAKLTEREKARLNRTLGQAIEKYQKLGKDAPGAMLALEKATRSAQRPTERLRGWVVGLGAAVGSFAGTLAAGVFSRAAQGLIDMAKAGAELGPIRASFDDLTGSIGATSRVMLTELRRGTRGLVTDLELMRTANNAMLLGVAESSQQMGELARVATILGRAVGRGPTDAINDLVVGMGRQSRQILDNLGIVVRAEDAYKKYAEAIGKSTSALTDQDRKLAFQQETLEQARAKAAELGDAALTAADGFARLKTHLANYIGLQAEGAQNNTVLAGTFNLLADGLDRLAEKEAKWREIRRRNRLRRGMGVPELSELDFEMENARALMQEALGSVNADPTGRHVLLNLGPTAEEVARLERETATLAETLSSRVVPALLTSDETMRDWAFTMAKTVGMSGLKGVEDQAASASVPLKELVNTSTLHRDVLFTTIPAMRTMNEGIQTANRHAMEAHQRTGDWRVALDDLRGAFVDMAQIGGKSLGVVTRGIGQAIAAVNVLDKGIANLRSGFAGLSGGNILSGLAGVASGIGGIVSAAVAGWNAIKALGSAISGLFQSEETKEVSPRRDQFFGQFGPTLRDFHVALGDAGVAAEEADRLTLGLFNAETLRQWQAAQQAVVQAFARQGRHDIQTFRLGTAGVGFPDFGRGTVAVLHGREAVVPEHRAQDFAAANINLAGVEARLASIENLLFGMPRAFGVEVQAGIAAMPRPRGG